MKINRTLIASIAITSAIFTGVTAWQLKGAEPSEVQAQPIVNASPTQPVSKEPSEVIENPNPLKLPAGNIWTFDCEIPVQLPESFYLTCGDGGWYVYNIKWQSWGESEAIADAFFSENVCDPSCAEGYRVETPVTLSLTKASSPGKKIYLTNLDMRASTEQNFKNGDRTIIWDLGEFAKFMDSE